MSNIQFTNFAATTLDSGINGVVTSLTVAPGTGALFPTLAGAQYFYCVLADAATGTTREVIKVTARSTDTFTITRAQDGTTGQTYITGDKVELRLTAAGIATLATTETAQTFAGVQTFSSAPVLSAPLAASGGGTGIANNAASTLTITGSFGTTFTVGATTALTLPASGTVATLAGSETLTNKTLTLSGLLTQAAGADIASAATIDLSTATGNGPRITGTTAISAVTMTTGQQVLVVADGALPLTYNATTNKLNSAAASVTLAAGDMVLYSKDLSGIVHGNIIKANGTSVVSAGSSSPISTPDVKLTGTSATFTIPTGVTKLKITVQGGGGNGAAGNAGIGSNGGSGGAGGYALAYLTGLTPGNTITYTVGGVGGTSSISSGTETITTVTCTGGSAGTTGTMSVTCTGGAGGSATNGTINADGEKGGFVSNAGSSPFGGAGSVAASTAGTAATGFGSGGGGGNGTVATAGAGKAGVIIFEY